jgi:High potential iron-sulfur protein
VKEVVDQSRRQLLTSLTLSMALLPLAGTLTAANAAADAPLVAADDATAKALKYVGDASKAADAKPGSKCANCTLYQGAAGSVQGGCLLFPGKSVKAGGWCSSWAAKTP